MINKKYRVLRYGIILDSSTSSKNISARKKKMKKLFTTVRHARFSDISLHVVEDGLLQPFFPLDQTKRERLKEREKETETSAWERSFPTRRKEIRINSSDTIAPSPRARLLDSFVRARSRRFSRIFSARERGGMRAPLFDTKDKDRRNLCGICALHLRASLKPKIP